MKRSLKKLSILLLAAALFGIPLLNRSQDDLAGHDHDRHEHDGTEEEHGHEVHDEGGEAHSDEHSGEHADEVTLSEDAIRLFNLTIERAERKMLTSTSSVPARVEYNGEAMAHIGSQVQGRVQNILVRLGDEVRQGDLLLVVDSPELGAAQSDFLQKDAAVDAARTNVEVARSLVEVARTSFERAEQLKAAKGISITDYLERQGTLREAEANVRRADAEQKVAESARLAAENQLHIYGYRHEDCDALLASGEITTLYEIRSPIAGRVIAREVTPGEVVAPDREPLMILANMDELWVIADVPEQHVPQITKGTPARVTMGALGDLAFDGTISYVAPQLDPKTRTAPVRIVVPATASPRHAADEQEVTTGSAAISAIQLLRPGMFGQAELSLNVTADVHQKAEAVLAVPEAAIQDVEGGPAVFVPVEGEPNTFAMRPVRVGPRIGHWLPVLAGLNEGESYVATNTYVLKAEIGKGGAEHVH